MKGAPRAAGIRRRFPIRTSASSSCHTYRRAYVEFVQALLGGLLNHYGQIGNASGASL